MGPLVRGSTGVLVLVLMGELVGRAGFVDQSYLPPSSTVLAHAGGLLADGEFLRDVAFTLGGWSSGVFIAIVIAVPAGVLLVCGWNASVAQQGRTVTSTAPAWARGLALGANTTIGFHATGAATPAPSGFRLGTASCTAG